MYLALIGVPIASGILSFLFRKYEKLCLGLIIVTAIIHSTVTAFAWVKIPPPLWKNFLALDELGLLFLSLTSLLFLIVSIYTTGYLAHYTKEKGTYFCGCLLFFLATMTLVAISQNMELLWVGIEATTLASAPLIYFYRTPQSLEATWKYFMICSVGIALALLGNFCLAVATSNTGGDHTSMILGDLVANARSFHGAWLKAAFILLLIGYGTKMGLAPLHAWLPDAHSEAPAFVSALLSGALLNSAFLGILRIYQICYAAGLQDFAQTELQIFGLLSIAFAAAFILHQPDYKRMLAYSSVEHMGILALSIGLGGSAIFGGLLHAVNHSLTKAMLFLVSGNILIAYKSRLTKMVTGMSSLLPISAMLWVIGFLAITGMPPFGMFISKFLILKAAFEQGQILIAVVCLACLAIIFIGMAGIILRMFHGESPTPKKESQMEHNFAPEPIWSIIPPLCFAALILLLGLHLPQFLEARLTVISQILGGQ